jgi:hypothetical protein
VQYHWTECPACHCQVAVNTSAGTAGGALTGSLRRWSTDRTINDGRPIQGLTPDATGGYETSCVCGAPIRLGATPDAVAAGRG